MVRLVVHPYVHGQSNHSGGMHYGTPAHNSLSVLVEYFSRFPEHSKKVVINLKGCWDTGANKPRCSKQTQGTNSMLR